MVDVYVKLCYHSARLMEQPQDTLLYGTVEEALPNALFRVLIDGSDEPVIAYLAGKMRRFRIRVLVGDRVAIVPDPYGGKGRITKRL
jgi:translation initiation factor IF-1